MAEEIKTNTENQELADPYHANAIDLATLAISTVGNVLGMLAKSNDNVALATFVLFLSALSATLWKQCEHIVTANELKSAEELRAKFQVEIERLLKEAGINS